MLADADAAVVGRDADLPGLSLLLDPQACRERLRALRPGDPVNDLQLDYLRYKPATSCVAALHWHNAEGRRQVLHAKALTRERHAEARRHPRWQLGGEPHHYARHDCEDHAVYLFDPAQDRGLRIARRLYLPAQRPAVLEGWTGTRAAPVAFTPLRHKPGRRIVARLGSAESAQAWLLRACSAEGYDAAALGARFGAHAGGAELIGLCHEHRLIATAWLPGRSLCPVAAGGLAAADDYRQLGARIAAMHASDDDRWPQAFVAAGRVRTRLHEQDAMGQAAAGLAALAPELGPLALWLVDRITRALLDRPWRPVAIHGDLSADQAVAGGAGVRLIDWDRATLGDAAADAGSFAAQLELQVLCGQLPADAGDAARRAFEEGLGATQPIDRRALALHTAAGLMLRVGEPFRQRLPRWPEHAAAVLERAQAWLDDTRPATAARRPATQVPPAPAAPVAIDTRACIASPSDPALPCLATALDPVAIGPALRQAIGLPDTDPRRLEARLRRHKPGRRCLIEYRFMPQDGAPALHVLGKVRARGADLRSLRLHQALRSRGFDGSAPHGVSVPAPLGVLPDCGMWLQRLEPGEPIGALLRPGESRLLAARAARALGALHRHGPAGGRPWHLSDELHMLAGRLIEVARDVPAWSDRMIRLLRACESIAADLGAQGIAHCGIHRDFHPDQLLVDGQRMVLVDLDLYAQGDPALDAGNFLAHLQELALRRHHDARALAGEEAAFADAFLAASPGCTPARLQAWTTLALARHVSLSRQIAGRAHTTEALLAMCEARIR